MQKLLMLHYLLDDLSDDITGHFSPRTHLSFYSSTYTDTMYFRNYVTWYAWLTRTHW
jgi:hypothetical protein